MWELLFELATWHGLAKLCLHTETTVRDLENSTQHLGKLLRNDFKKGVCEDYMTFDLPSEEAARGHRKAANAKRKLMQLLPNLCRVSHLKGKKKRIKVNQDPLYHICQRNLQSLAAARVYSTWGHTRLILLVDTQRQYVFMAQLTTVTLRQ